MPSLSDLLGKLFSARDRRFEKLLRDAELRLNAVVMSGTSVDSEIVRAIFQARDAYKAGNLDAPVETAFFSGYARLAELAKKSAALPAGASQGYEDPFADAVNDAEQLLRYAAESGTDISAAVAGPILSARSAFAAGNPGEDVRALFYDAYAKLARLFGDVTAESIRNCTSPETQSHLTGTRRWAIALTTVVAAASVITFVGDSMVKTINEDILSGNESAAKLRAALSGTDGVVVGAEKFLTAPCDQLSVKPEGKEYQIKGLPDIQEIQKFASTIRDLQGRALKLNVFVGGWEVNPLAPCPVSHRKSDKEEECVNLLAKSGGDVEKLLQLDPAITNYTAEFLCKIAAYQHVRDFATNVRSDYAAVIGAVAAYALPIAYALLGALAYKLRMFGDTIRRRTYHPSFADSARTTTAAIAGAISGLFNPAQGLSLSPLAVAFLVGYGVELFFRFLDTNINSFGAGPQPRAGGGAAISAPAAATPVTPAPSRPAASPQP